MFYDSITLHFKPALGQPLAHLTLTPAPVNVLVGPNGAGKSLALRELAKQSKDKKIVCARSVSRETLQEAREWRGRTDPLIHGEINDRIAALPESLHADLCSFKLPALADHADVAAMIKGERTDWRSACRVVVERLKELEAYRVVLSTFQSLGQIERGDRGRFASSPRSRLDVLYRNKESLERFRDIILENFGVYPVIDASSGKLFLRLSQTRPAEGLEYVNSPESESFMDRAHMPEQLSDGSRTYLGLWGHLLSGDERLIFLDEAGSLLHPPLARLLGKQLANVAMERRGHLFAATHSADFVLGCIQAGCRVNVIRLTYRDGVSTARVLSAEDLRPLMHDPLLRSANVLSGLFHDGVVVCEADADRAFYQEINERLLDNKEGMPSCHFVNAQNWQTIPRITTALRGLGVPAAMLVDLDAVIHPDMIKLIESAGVPPATLRGMGQVRGELARDFDNKERREQLKREGLGLVSKEMLPSWLDYMRHLAEYGIFVVPVGELEGWLPSFNVPRGRKGQWIVQIFACMGSDPEDIGYLRPDNGGPWKLMREVAKWIHDPERRGMPAPP